MSKTSETSEASETSQTNKSSKKSKTSETEKRLWMREKNQTKDTFRWQDFGNSILSRLQVEEKK